MFELGKKDGSDNENNSAAGNDSQQDLNSSHTNSTARPATATGGVAVIGRSIRINGDLQGEEDLRIEGDVNGTVRLQNHTLTIGGEGKLRADVYAKSVIVEGAMEGDLFSSERVVVRKTASVRGNIMAPRVSLDDGAKFKGSIEMDPDAVANALGASKNTASSKPKAKANGSQHAPKPKAANGGAQPGEPVG
ncbi:MAG: bactofilin family protein [Gammaproteobacteria bacterium]